MDVFKLLGIAGVMLPAFATVAAACPPPAPPVQIPGESSADYAARARIAHEDSLDEDRRAMQARFFDQADRITLAGITSSEPVAIDGWGVPITGHRIVARPIASLKGTAVTQPLVLADRSMSSCGLGGGGPATSEKPGAMIIVFMNVRIGDRLESFGIPLSAAREPRVMKALNEAAIALRKPESAGGRP